MKTRNLKIEATGDFCYGKIKPKIRLTGHWLERAGFKPGHRVAVQISEPGILTLRSFGKDESSSMPIAPARAGCPDVPQSPPATAGGLWQGVLELERANRQGRAQRPSETK
jgi:hypothetical protein